MSRAAGRGRALAVLACLALSGCSRADEQLQERINRARDRNAVVGAAIALLATLVVRHAVRALSARSARRAGGRPSGPYRTPRAVSAWLVAAAAMTEVLADGALLLSGAIIGWVAGPTPADDPTLQGVLYILVVAAVFVPAVILLAVAFLVQAVAARLPDVGVTTLVVLALPHTALVLFGLAVLLGKGMVGGLVPVALGSVGAYGFWSEAGRRRTRPAPAVR